ncbi:epimerase [Idiomarina sp. WRN-38]|uniref:TIGR01777 family oxidoreductase n=1 Tax=Idiomarina sp. OXR-189 TaxID=3100175 RepID=UPI00073390F4|nr:TIGR01777 family oxidoreductase [Idiomarina sp. OXR-189]KTG23269.1 epimerase [Idiomarina sp. H105]OAE90662.1 epimerase [Idiomarina sp. WRN-38]WPZ00583.1 TIGR01777 family oxidoreductase [Idiomarina sp. OXR-189]
MNILMTGGTGLIGSAFIRTYRSEHKFTVTTRNKERARKLLGDDVTLLSSVDEVTDIGQFDAVINLQGEGIADKRWSDSRKQALKDSRWQVTEKLAALINGSETPPPVFLSGSAIGYYGPRDSSPVNEEGEPEHTDFAVTLCQEWERRALAAEKATRVVLLRTGVVLAKGEGALAKMLPPYKFGLGGPLGEGKQMMSWIQLEDMIRAIQYLLEHDNLSGPVNMTAPGPVANEAFSRTLASVLNKPHFMRVPAFVLKLGLGEMSSMLLEGQAVVPDKLRNHGFEFKYPTVREAFQVSV